VRSAIHARKGNSRRSAIHGEAQFTAKPIHAAGKQVERQSRISIKPSLFFQKNDYIDLS
jgi:hypothetical protein